MERFVLFDRPVRLDLRPRNYNEPVIVPVWGFPIPDMKFTTYLLADYITYLLAVTRWEDEGNLVVSNEWITKDGVIHQTFDAEIQEYIHQYQSETPVKVTLWMTEDAIDRYEFFYEFIIDPEICSTIERNGSLVDVVMAPSTEDR